MRTLQHHRHVTLLMTALSGNISVWIFISLLFTHTFFVNACWRACFHIASYELFDGERGGQRRFQLKDGTVLCCTVSTLIWLFFFFYISNCELAAGNVADASLMFHFTFRLYRNSSGTEEKNRRNETNSIVG